MISRGINNTKEETEPKRESGSTAPPQISRRGFLKAMGTGIALGGVAGAGLYGSKIHQSIYGTIRESGGKEAIPVEPDFAEKYRLELQDIAFYRQRLGLSDIPTGLEQLLHNQPAETSVCCKWEGDPPEYQCEVPEKNLSYAARNWELIEGAFGTNNATRLIAGSRSNPNYPYGMSFDGGTRFCNISDAVHDIKLDVYTDYGLHEACGHGSDPAVGAKYPPEVLIAVEHGKWRALSKAFEIRDQFLNHPGDMVYPYLKKELGKKVAPMARGFIKTSPVEEAYEKKYRAMLEEIAKEKGLPLKDLKFNKAVCKDLGKRLAESVRSGTIRLSKEVGSFYQDVLESGLVEIYAEMFKYSLRYPDLVGYDTDVIGGITEVCNAVSGVTRSPDDIRKATLVPTPEVQERNRREKEYIEKLAKSEKEAGTEITTLALTPEEEARIKEQEEEFTRKEKVFNDFCEGKIEWALMAKGSKDLISSYTRLYTRVLEKYPMLKDTFAQHLDESFDPDLDIWNIEKVEYAVDTDFIRNLLLNPEHSLTPKQEYDLACKVAILGGFIDGQPF